MSNFIPASKHIGLAPQSSWLTGKTPQQTAVFHSIDELIDSIAVKTEQYLLTKVERGEVPTEEDFAAARRSAKTELEVYCLQLAIEHDRAKRQANGSKKLVNIELGKSIREELKIHRDGKEK